MTGDDSTFDDDEGFDSDEDVETEDIEAVGEESFQE